MKVQFVTAVHGNEPTPTLALASMGIKQIVANPRALARRVRYVEKDLNASFGTGGGSYEERRAREIKKLLLGDLPVVDLHTFSCVSEPFVIVVDLEMMPLVRLTGLRRVVYMKHNIKAGHALINHHRGISIELGKHESPKSFSMAQQIVTNLEREKSKNNKMRVYEVLGRIEKVGDYRNFVERKGMVPVLYGERAYPDRGFYGLKAREITGTIDGEER